MFHRVHLEGSHGPRKWRASRPLERTKIEARVLQIYRVALTFCVSLSMQLSSRVYTLFFQSRTVLVIPRNSDGLTGRRDIDNGM